MRWTDLARYWHTLSPLKAIQVSRRLLQHLRWSRPDLRPFNGRVRSGIEWQPHLRRRPCAVTATTATYLGQDLDVSGKDAWTRRDVPLLWLYNLHYFDDMTSESAGERREWQGALVRRWLAEHPPVSKPGWDPYPTSLRLVNWTKTAWAPDSEGRSIIDDSAAHSMAVQARWLSGHIEYHLQANHLWANAKALAFAGAFFEGDEGKAWLKTGLTLVEQELHEQILPDGGHYERSPMYHAIVLEDVLDLIQLDRAVPGALTPTLSATLREKAPRMLRWMQAMSHPDGDLAFFNDAAFGIAPRVSALERYAQQLGVSVPVEPFRSIEWLKDSGYIRLTSPEAVVICDVAPIAPAYQPGHTHADTLSFELSVNGKRAIVNSGTSTYERNELRAWQRSTAAHNTVVVNGENSSDVWAAFRVGRRARITHADAGVDASGVAWATGTHDGYTRGRRGALHTRRWELSQNELRTTDTLSNDVRLAEACLYFAPDADSTMSVTWDTAAVTATEPASWYPEFGRAISNVRTRTTFSGRELVTTISWRRDN